MDITINLSEQIDKCGDEYLDEQDIPACFKDWNETYVCMKLEGRVFLIQKSDIEKLALIMQERHIVKSEDKK